LAEADYIFKNMSAITTDFLKNLIN
jgi:hypothetical protein